MDPNATLELITRALQEGDREEAYHAARDLDRWIRMGGFPPADPGYNDVLDEALGEQS